VFAGLFIVAERFAKEPIIPLRLFGNSIFSIGNLYGFLAGLAMFGGVIFLPLYFQGVMGMTPTESGLAMIPMVAGIFTTAIGVGQLITRTGKYKIYPILGAIVIIGALLLLNRIEVDTPYWQVAIYAYLFGFGLGTTMQTITVAVQNAVEFRDMGAATSTTAFARNLGAAIGTAVFGAILNTRLADHLKDSLAAAKIAPPAGALESTSNIQAMRQLEEPIRSIVLNAYTNAIADLFLVAIPFVVLALVVALMLKEIPLRTGGAPIAVDGEKRPQGTADEESEAETKVPVFSGH